MAIAYRAYSSRCPTFINKSEVGKFDFRSHEITVALMPSDRRGYRTHMFITHPDIARPYSFREKSSLHTCLGVMSEVYAEMGLLPQTFVSEDATRSPVKSLTGHVVGRGDPNHEYVKGLRLNGPFIEHAFDLKGDPKKRKQGNACIEWSDADMIKMTDALSQSINNVLKKNSVFMENILRAYAKAH